MDLSPNAESTSYYRVTLWSAGKLRTDFKIYKQVRHFFHPETVQNHTERDLKFDRV